MHVSRRVNQLYKVLPVVAVHRNRLVEDPMDGGDNVVIPFGLDDNLVLHGRRLPSVRGGTRSERGGVPGSGRWSGVAVLCARVERRMGGGRWRGASGAAVLHGRVEWRGRSVIAHQSQLLALRAINVDEKQD